MPAARPLVGHNAVPSEIFCDPVDNLKTRSLVSHGVLFGPALELPWVAGAFGAI